MIGGSNHIFAHGKMEKKVYGKKGKSIHLTLFPYTFFPMGKTHFSMGKNGVEPPGPNNTIIAQQTVQITRFT